MAKTNNFFNELFLFGRDIFCGNDKVSSIFSFDGVLNRPLGWATAIVLHMFLQIISWFGIKLLTFVLGLAVFYCVLALVQKRCRDFGRSGTLCVIFVSLLKILESLVYFLHSENPGIIYLQLNRLENISYCFLIVPLLIPSKPEPDMELRSPLLKYPLLYTVICGVLSVAVIWAVSFYAGVDVNIL